MSSFLSEVSSEDLLRPLSLALSSISILSLPVIWRHRKVSIPLNDDGKSKQFHATCRRTSMDPRNKENAAGFSSKLFRVGYCIVVPTFALSRLHGSSSTVWSVIHATLSSSAVWKSPETQAKPFPWITFMDPRFRISVNDVVSGVCAGEIGKKWWKKAPSFLAWP